MNSGAPCERTSSLLLDKGFVSVCRWVLTRPVISGLNARPRRCRCDVHLCLAFDRNRIINNVGLTLQGSDAWCGQVTLWVKKDFIDVMDVVESCTRLCLSFKCIHPVLELYTLLTLILVLLITKPNLSIFVRCSMWGRQPLWIVRLILSWKTYVKCIFYPCSGRAGKIICILCFRKI